MSITPTNALSNFLTYAFNFDKTFSEDFKRLLEDGTLSPVSETHLGSIQVGRDQKAWGYYVVVDGVHQKDLPIAGTVTNAPDTCQTKQIKVYTDSIR